MSGWGLEHEEGEWGRVEGGSGEIKQQLTRSGQVDITQSGDNLNVGP